MTHSNDLSRPSKKTLSDIIAYYDDTQSDYSLLWFGQQDRAVHFGYYDDTIRKHKDALTNLNQVLADTVQISAHDHVLDAGCGQGGSSVWLAKTIGATAVGITPVSSQVELGQAYVHQQGLADKVQIKQGDYTQTGFDDNSFDVVWACESLCHADHKERFYQEAYRILKPGGRLVIAEYIRASDADHQAADTLLSAWLNGWAINHIDTREQHRQHAESSGFTAVIIRDVTQHTEPSLRVLYRLSIILKPLGFLLRFLRIRSEHQHGNLIGSLNQYKALKLGYWFYGIISAEKPRQ